MRYLLIALMSTGLVTCGPGQVDTITARPVTACETRGDIIIQTVTQAQIDLVKKIVINSGNPANRIVLCGTRLYVYTDSSALMLEVERRFKQQFPKSVRNIRVYFHPY